MGPREPAAGQLRARGALAAVPVTDSRDRISGAKKTPGAGIARVGDRREFLNLARMRASGGSAGWEARIGRDRPAQ